MGRKSRTKRNAKEWEKSLAVYRNASSDEITKAENIYTELDSRYHVKRSTTFVNALNRIYEIHGEKMGALVMVIFANREGFVRV